MQLGCPVAGVGHRTLKLSMRGVDQNTGKARRPSKLRSCKQVDLPFLRQVDLQYSGSFQPQGLG